LTLAASAAICVPADSHARESAGELDEAEGVLSYKLNKVYAGCEGRTKVWHEPGALMKSGIAEIGRWCREAGVMSLAFMLNPYSHLEFESQEEELDHAARCTWSHSDPHSLETLRRVFKLGLGAGAATVLLLADDFVPREGRNRNNFGLYTPEDPQRFLNLQNAHALSSTR
jgi:hypothetical protein